MDSTEHAVVGQGKRVVVVPVGTEQLSAPFFQEVVNQEPAELESALVSMKITRTIF